MNIPERARSKPRWLVLLTSLLIVASGLIMPSIAQAAPAQGTVSGASLDWGIKQSFRTYVVSPIAHGSITNLGTTTGQFRWTGGSGTAATDGSAADVSFGAGNGAHFRGHEMNGVDALDLAFTNPRVEVTSPSTANLYLDVQGREFAGMTETGEEFTLTGVHFGNVALPSATTDGSTITWTNAPVTLTEAGASAFGGFYGAGTALDPLTLSLPVTDPATATTTSLEASSTSTEVGADVTLTATVAPADAAGTVAFASGATALGEPVAVENGTAALTTDALPAGENSITAAFTPADAAAFAASTSTAVTVTVNEPATEPEPVWEPEIEVFLADGVTPVGDAEVFVGDELVVKGSGFDPAANVGGRGVPIPNTLPQGAYAVFGHFAQDWRPSQDAPSASRAVGSQGWVLTEETLNQIPPMFQQAVRDQWIPQSAEGDFTWTVTIESPATSVENGRFGIYTYAAGGTKNADQELYVPLNYQGDRPEPEPEPVWEPEIEVFLADGVTPVGDTEVFVGDELVVKGSGFDPAANVGGRGVPIPNTLPQGAYAVFGHFAQDWRPSQDAPGASRAVGSQGWVLTEETLEQIPAPFQQTVRDQWIPQSAEGDFTWTVKIESPATSVENGRFGIYTYAAGGTKNADQELYVPLNYQGKRPPSVIVSDGDGAVTTVKHGDALRFEAANLDPGQDVRFEVHSEPVVVGTVAVGEDGSAGIDWTVPADFEAGAHEALVFVDGETDPIARQGFTVLAAAPVDQCQALSGDELRWGVKNTFRTYVTGPIAHGTAALLGSTTQAGNGAFVWTNGLGSADTDGNGVDVAFGAGNGVRFRGHAMNGGFALDLAFTNPRVVVTSASTAQLRLDVAGREFDSTTSVGAPFELADVHFADLALSAPATSGSTRTWSNATATLTQDGAVAFGGFYEAGTALDPVTFRVTAGSLVDCGSIGGPTTGSGETPIPNPDATGGTGGAGGVVGASTSGTSGTAEKCVARRVTGGSFDWGVKESFRTYVEGNIAKGEFSGGSFTASGGAINTANGGIGRANFSGTLSATGHGGKLNFKLSNPSVQITGPTTAVLNAQVSSTNTKGETTVDGTVAFANLSFNRLAIDGDTLSVSGASATLTNSAAQAFQGFYEAGTALDAVSFSVSLGAEVPCDSSTDPKAVGKLPKTGADVDPSMLALAGLTMLAGAAVMARRRRVGAQH